MKGITMQSTLLLSLALASAMAACERTAPASAQTATDTPVATKALTTVAKIVFIDLENACDCTRTRIEDTWAAMQVALGTPARLPVERIHADTQKAEAEVYTVSKPLMVPPGIYFTDANNAVIDMLQGEVKAEQIAAMLKGR